MIVLTANESQNISTSIKPEAKSQAEERLIKKIAKMALNGYEIGIQRKIKPADHIQSMADRIQDTVVTKHPLNSDNILSADSSREGTLKRTPSKPVDRFKTTDSIQSIGNKIKDAILSNHPVAANFTNGNSPIPPPIPNSPIPTLKSYNTPKPPPLPDVPVPTVQFHNISSVPPPIPASPVPTFKVHSSSIVPPLPDTLVPSFKTQSTLISHTLGNGASKRNEIPKELTADFSQVLEVSNNLNRSSNYNGNDYKNNSDNKNDSKTENSFINTLKKKKVFEKSSLEPVAPKLEINNDRKVNDNYSNTINKKYLFEKRDTANGAKSMILDDINKQVSEKSTSLVNNSIKKTANVEDNISIKYSKEDDRGTHPILPNNLHDNSLYQYKPMKVNGTHGNGCESLNGNKLDENQMKNSDDNPIKHNDPSEPEVIVKRREKKIDRNNDGRRDSHIIARPLSTMTSLDVTDGLYPVCHKCDRPITR